MLPGALPPGASGRNRSGTGARSAARSGAGVASAAATAAASAARTPTLTDVICLERCADVREATVGSRSSSAARSLEGADAVRFAADGGGRVTTAPTSVASSAIEVEVPERPRPERSGRAPTASRPRRRRQAAQGRSPRARSPRAGGSSSPPPRPCPVEAYYDARAQAPGLLHLPGRGADRRPDRDRQERDRRGRRHAWIQPAAQPGTPNVPSGTGEPADGTPAPGRQLQVRGRPCRRRRHRVDHRGSGFGYHIYRFPLDGPPHLRRRDRRRAQTTRARTCSPSAAPDPRRPRRPGADESTSNRPPATTWSSTARAPGSTPCTPTCSEPLAAAGGRPRAHRPGDRQRRPDRQRVRLSPALRDLVGARLVRGRQPDAVGRQPAARLGRWS